MIDDHSRLAYTEIHRDEKAPTVVAFVERALEFFAAHGITARRLQTDNAWSYTRNRDLRELLARARHPSPHDPAPHAQAQRQGRALPADPRPRMGLRTALSRLTRPRGSAADLARALQLHPQPQLALQPAAHHPRSGPAEAQQLAPPRWGRRRRSRRACAEPTAARGGWRRARLRRHRAAPRRGAAARPGEPGRFPARPAATPAARRSRRVAGHELPVGLGLRPQVHGEHVVAVGRVLGADGADHDVPLDVRSACRMEQLDRPVAVDVSLRSAPLPVRPRPRRRRHPRR